MTDRIHSDQSPTPMGDLPILWSVSDVATYLGLSVTTVRDMVRRGELPAYSVRRRTRISESDVKNMLDQSRSHKQKIE